MKWCYNVKKKTTAFETSELSQCCKNKHLNLFTYKYMYTPKSWFTHDFLFASL